MAGRNRTSKSLSRAELWQMAKNWLASSNVLPPGHKVYDVSPTVFDLAHSLRDGVALCQIANCLRPYSVRDINLKPQMSPFLCLKNIRGFLHACVNNFGLKESVLFDAHELYDVSDFGKVVNTLSHLSKCKDAISAGLISFPSDKALTLNVQQKDEDIYGNLEEIAMTKEVAEENVYDAVTIEDDTKIYDDVVALKQRIATQDSHTSKTDEKRDYVIEELLGTEQNYVAALTTIKENFIDKLDGVLSPEDRKIIFVNIEDLLTMHKKFLAKLERACLIKKDTGCAISSCFVISKDEFLEYGKYCREMQAAQNHVDKLCESDAEVNRLMAECCESANDGKFGLRSLLVIPMQRVLKYPLLLRELIKHSKSYNTDKASLEKALQAMQDVARYINAVKRDDECMNTVNQISSSLIKDKEDMLPELITFGLLVKDGDIQIKFNEERALKKRYAFLLDRVLLMCKVRGEQYHHKETLHLDHYNVSDSVNSPGKGKFVHGWTMNGNSPEAGKGCFEMFTKTDDMKRKWVEDIQRTISNLTLSDYNLGNHRFELTTFHSATYCVVCKNLLWGLINQGYVCKASGCSHICHKDCIEKSPVCKSSKNVFDHPSIVHSSRYPTLTKQVSDPVIPNSPPLPPRVRNVSEPVITNLPSPHVIAITRFHGHAPGRKTTLVFDAGEEIEVIQRNDPEWWEGKSVKTGKHGYFPRNHVENVDSRRKSVPLQRTMTKYMQSSDIPPTTPEEVVIIDGDLSLYKWFVGKVEREDAKERLEKTTDGTFLVRESTAQAGQYALSLRHKYNVKHIKIVVSNGMFCVTALKLFPSIQAMIDYYRNNTLGVSFPGLDTCLTRGINEARRESKSQGIGYARVKFDYEARDPREISIKKQSNILIINKDGDWWKGENNEGQVGFFPSNFVKMLDDDSLGT